MLTYGPTIAFTTTLFPIMLQLTVIPGIELHCLEVIHAQTLAT